MKSGDAFTAKRGKELEYSLNRDTEPQMWLPDPRGEPADD
jgi:hypothetical protein